MDRIRAGLTGLAAVFLVTAVASVVFAPDEAQTEAAAKQEPGEPLAQLGVAPGSDKAGAAGTAGNPKSDDKPALEAQPSGGVPQPGHPVDPVHPSPVLSLGQADRDRPVAI